MLRHLCLSASNVSGCGLVEFHYTACIQVIMTRPKSNTDDCVLGKSCTNQCPISWLLSPRTLAVVQFLLCPYHPQELGSQSLLSLECSNLQIFWSLQKGAYISSLFSHRLLKIWNAWRLLVMEYLLFICSIFWIFPLALPVGGVQQ